MVLQTMHFPIPAAGVIKHDSRIERCWEGLSLSSEFIAFISAM